MSTLSETLWNEPPAPGAEAPRRRDWVLVAAIVALSAAEGVLREELTWRPLAVVVSVGLALTLPWRRTYPLAAVALAFGCTAALQSLARLRGVDWQVLDASVFLVILPYALLRWGSGREVVAGLAVIALAFATAVPGAGGWSESIGAALLLLFPAALGASLRYRDSARRRAIEQVRSREREHIARELHDTVAHHVSAIAVQAQAGRAVAGTRPGAPLEALAVIEEAASRTLVEMRHIVQALREDGEGVRAPAEALADIERLAEEGAFAPRVEVAMSGELDDVDGALGTTLYRLTREALTNTARHARGARVVSVRVSGEATRVCLRIVDDGQAPLASADAGFGLRGMRERVSLLGGTLGAGPGSGGGWVIEATLPKRQAGS